MDNPIHNEVEIEELRSNKFFGSNRDTETNDDTSMSIKEPDTMLSMIVLLLTCLALAALAHVFVL